MMCLCVQGHLGMPNAELAKRRHPLVDRYGPLGTAERLSCDLMLDAYKASPFLTGMPSGQVEVILQGAISLVSTIITL